DRAGPSRRRGGGVPAACLRLPGGPDILAVHRQAPGGRRPDVSAHRPPPRGGPRGGVRPGGGGGVSGGVGWPGRGGPPHTRRRRPGTIAGGRATLTEAIRARLGSRVVLGAEVLEVAQDGDGVRVRYRLGNAHEEVRASHCVLATPAPVARRLAIGLAPETADA